MTWKVFDRVRETSTTAGTGALTLAGAAAKSRTFSSVLATNDTCFYAVQSQSAEEWEVGVGKLTAATTFSRDVVLSSSNASALVNFSAGTKDVFLCAAGAMENAESLLFFGDASDGDVVIASGTTTLTRDMYYRNLTISGTGALVTNGFRVFVQERLDLTAAPAGAIRADGGNGSGGSAATGGAAGAVVSAGTVGGGGPGSAGGNGSTTASGSGAASAAPTNQTPANGGASGTSGAGGDGDGAGGPGATTAGATVAGSLSLRRWTSTLLRGASLIVGGAGGPGGGGGGASSGNGPGGGGGGGGAGGGIVWISARIVDRTASTAAGAIRANGGTGGNGAVGQASGNSGGGGGGSGAGGGWVFLAYLALRGASATNAVQASGGTGGAGGNGLGSAAGGRGGSGGSGGRITALNLGTGTVVESVGTAGTAGGANSGTTGGSAGAANTLQVSL
ncbi:MAG TPA: hypothetical protein VER11_12375 [Polyangiaceae bacterium]|nr:hypothetical protein [Polyangiaceae bacterium]